MADQFLAAIFGHEDAAAELAGASEEQWGGLEEGADELEEALELELEGGAVGDDGGLTWDATPEEVVRRIHSVTLWFLDQLRAGSLPDIELASRSGGNRRGSEEDEDAEDDEDSGAGGGGGGGSGEPAVRRMQQQQQQQQQQTQRRTLSRLGRHPESADALARLFLLLAAVQEQLLAGAQATQRELWYRLKTLEVKHWRGTGCCHKCCMLPLHATSESLAAALDRINTRVPRLPASLPALPHTLPSNTVQARRRTARVWGGTGCRSPATPPTSPATTPLTRMPS